MKKLRIFVTGSSGFIARNIIEKLGGKYKFIAPTHKELDLLDSTAVNWFFKKNEYFDFVIHTAIVGGNRKVANTSEIAIVNLRMFFNLARNRQYFVKMIHLGSGIEYGKERPLKKVKETDFDKFIPQDNFGLYKYLCGKYIETADGILNLRLFGVFGKYEDSTIRFISNAICKSILGIPITINQNIFLDYLYIDDFIRILDYFLSHKTRYKSYNVGTGKSIDLITSAKKINQIAVKESKIVVAHKGLENEYTCSNRRLMEELGDFNFNNFDISLEELYNWYLERKNELKKRDFLDDYFR